VPAAALVARAAALAPPSASALCWPRATGWRARRRPGLIGLRHGELALQVVGRDDRRLATTHTRATAIAGLRAQSFEFEQSGHPVFAAGLAQIAHVQGQLAVAVHAAALQPRVLEQAQQPLIVLGTRAHRIGLPGVVAAGMHRHDLAHAAHAVLVFMPFDKCVLHPDCLAKYAAAFFRMSRSSVTRLSSAFKRRISSTCEPCAWR